MAKVRILIVEDDAEQAALISTQLTQLGYSVTGIGPDLTTALGLYFSQQPDLVVVDIYLDGKPDGITFAKRLQENPQSLRPFIFLTAHADLPTFEAAKMTLPYSYLLKPFNPLELQYAIELALDKSMEALSTPGLRQEGLILKQDVLFIKKGHSLVKVKTEDIDYVEVQGKYSNIQARQEGFLVQQPLKHLLQLLGAQSFVRTHRNFAVNLRSIKQVFLQDDRLVLNSNQEVPVSQSYKKQLGKLLKVLK